MNTLIPPGVPKPWLLKFPKAAMCLSFAGHLRRLHPLSLPHTKSRQAAFHISDRAVGHLRTADGHMPLAGISFPQVVEQPCGDYWGSFALASLAGFRRASPY